MRTHTQHTHTHYTTDPTLQDRNSKLLDYALEISKLKEEKVKLAREVESLGHQLRLSPSTPKAANVAKLSKPPLMSQSSSYTNLLSLSKGDSINSLSAAGRPKSILELSIVSDK